MQQHIGARPLTNGSYTRTQGAPSTDVYPRFFMDTVEDLVATERAGHPIFRDEERVEINIPGNPHTKPVMLVTDRERRQWPEAYEAFKKGQEVAVHGTPLEYWSILKPSQVRELKAIGLLTIEHVRDMNDHAIQRIPMFGHKIRQMAQAYLDEAAAFATVTAAQAESERKDARIAELELHVTNLQTQMTSMFAQLQEKLNTPNPLMTAIPGMSDPVELAKFGKPEEPVRSAFDDLPMPPPRRRKAAEATAAT